MELTSEQKNMVFQRRYIDVARGNLVVAETTIPEFTLESIWGVVCDKCDTKHDDNNCPCHQLDKYHGDPTFIDGLEDTLSAMKINELSAVTDNSGYRYLVARIK